MRTSLAELHGLVFLLAVVTVSHCWDGVNLQLTSFKHLFFVSRPTPAVGEQMGHDSRHLADVHHHAGDMIHVILLRHCFDVLDNIKYDSEFVHGIQFSVISCSVFLAEDDFSGAFEHVRQDATELVL